MKHNLLFTFTITAALLAPAIRAEEGGSAHYLPGTTASFIDAFPAKPGSIAALDYFTYYDANASPSRTLVFGGLLAADVHASIYANTLAGVYQSPWDVAGGGLAFGLALPYLWMDVAGQARRIGPGGVPGPVFSAHDTTDGFGDLQIIPFMLGWTNILPDLKLDARLGVFAPTGDYNQERLANVGKHYWTFEPGVMASWLSSKIGTEASLYAGVDFNTENDTTHYQNGTSLHLDATVAQHLPVGKGFIGLGANAFYYQQLSGDSGSGARLGDFESMTAGVGPVLSYVCKVGKKTDLVAEVKWLPELDVNKRLKGDMIWFKLALVF